MVFFFLGKPIKQENNDILQKYYDSITKAVLGNDLKLMRVGNSQTTGQVFLKNKIIRNKEPFLEYLHQWIKVISTMYMIHE